MSQNLMIIVYLDRLEGPIKGVLRKMSSEGLIGLPIYCVIRVQMVATTASVGAGIPSLF